MTLLSAWPLELRPFGAVDVNPRTGRPCAADDFWWFEDWHSTRQRPRHHAQDIFAPRGTLVRAPVDGRIIAAGRSPVSGLHVQLQTEDGHRVLMVHLDSVQAQEGEHARAGDLLGTVGTTGNATHTCPHLHIEAKDARGRAVNLFPDLERLDPTGPRARAVGEARA